MVKIGTHLSGAFSFEEQLQVLKNTGFDFVGLTLGLFKAEGDLVERTVSLCEKYGFEIDNIHLTGSKTNVMWSDDPLGDEICDRYCREIERASAAGIRAGVAHVTWGYLIPAPVGDIGLSRFERIAECAERNQFMVGLENSVDDKYLYATMERLRDYRYIGFTFDSGHHHAFAREHDFLTDFGDRLVTTHIADNDGAHDLHLMPMDGTIQWEQLAAKLAKTKVGRERILAEPSLGGGKKIRDMSAEQIRQSITHLPIAAEPELLVLEDERFSAYGPLTYEQKIERLYTRMKRLAAMIEAEIA